MNGPIKKPKRKIGLGLGKLELTSAFFGAIVVIGLVMELGTDISRAWRAHVLPSREVTGGILVAVGVFGEVAIGLVIARDARRSQLDSDERIALAEKQTAEANLATEQEKAARLRIEARFSLRTLNEIQREELSKRLSLYPGTRVDVITFDNHILEVALLADGLNAVLNVAGWNSKLWHMCAGFRMSGDGVSIGTARDSTEDEKTVAQSMASVLASSLSVYGIRAMLCLGGFARADPLVPNSVAGYEKSWHTSGIAALRVQIGQRPAISITELFDSMRPVTPPQT